jgi:Mrp family chromosome partitioning ATPase
VANDTKTGGSSGPTPHPRGAPGSTPVPTVADFDLEFPPEDGEFELEFTQPSSSALPTFVEKGRVTPRLVGGAQAAMLSNRVQVSEELRMLFANIRGIGEKEPFRSMGFVSAASGEGKTTLALGLASTIARERGRRVLLVEADLRRPGIERQLGLARTAGMGEWLEGGVGPLPVRKVLPAGFDVLTAGHSTTNAVDLINSQRMSYLLQAARLAYEYVLVDCPPLVPVIDSVLLQDQLDGFVFIVRACYSPRETILKAVNRLKPGRIRGMVFNYERELVGGYYTYGFRRYGETA